MSSIVFHTANDLAAMAWNDLRSLASKYGLGNLGREEMTAKFLARQSEESKKQLGENRKQAAVKHTEATRVYRESFSAYRMKLNKWQKGERKLAGLIVTAVIGDDYTKARMLSSQMKSHLSVKPKTPTKPGGAKK